MNIRFFISLVLYSLLNYRGRNGCDQRQSASSQFYLFSQLVWPCSIEKKLNKVEIASKCTKTGEPDGVFADFFLDFSDCFNCSVVFVKKRVDTDAYTAQSL